MYNKDYKINRTLRKLRILSGMTTEEIATAMGKSKQATSLLINVSQNPTIESL